MSQAVPNSRIAIGQDGVTEVAIGEPGELLVEARLRAANLSRELTVSRPAGAVWLATQR